jgi:putative membrane protein
MLEHIPYCGLPPAPGELLTRFNLDPVLLAALAVLAGWHVARARANDPGRAWIFALSGWLIATLAFASPLCALSVALFSARVAQHMILVLIAAPLIALAWPIKARAAGLAWPVNDRSTARAAPIRMRPAAGHPPHPIHPGGGSSRGADPSRPAPRRSGAGTLWLTAVAFFIALWFWHMPVPYDATFTSTPTYWCMHVTLFGTSILLWRALLHSHDRTVDVLTVGALTSMHMGLLGAVLTFAGHPLFLWHLTTTAAWGVSALRDQQLGGVFMWVPGIGLFLWAAMRSLGRLWSTLEGAKSA